MPDQPVEGLAEAGGEPEAGNQLGDLVLLLAGADVDAHQVLRPVDRLELAEVDHVYGDLFRGEQLLEGLVDRRLLVVVVQRDGPLGGTDGRRRASGQFGEARLEPADVAQGRGHQQELRLRQFQQRHLPGPAALRVGVEMELVHDHGAQVRGGALAEGDVGQDFGGAADDGRVLVDAGIAGDHAHVLRAENVAERKELLRHQGLDRRRVVAALSPGHGLEVRGDGDQGLSRPGRRGENDVGAGGKLHHGFILRGVERQARGFRSIQRSGCRARPDRGRPCRMFGRPGRGADQRVSLLSSLVPVVRGQAHGPRGRGARAGHPWRPTAAGLPRRDP